ncbi:PDDEXK nuclease domain-containing protein [Paenarthrobacter nicotinovorans]|uniref:PDDEXK nuclease domain-containing protein n=1 Tax=Paenarthrobacter nicotinovorans TaxID=29320 RepID=UPI003D792582
MPWGVRHLTFGQGKHSTASGLGLWREVAERDLELALTSRITETLREPGPGFSFVGRQVHFDVDGDDYYIDTLFLLIGTVSGGQTHPWQSRPIPTTNSLKPINMPARRRGPRCDTRTVRSRRWMVQSRLYDFCDGPESRAETNIMAGVGLKIPAPAAKSCVDARGRGGHDPPELSKELWTIRLSHLTSSADLVERGKRR